MILIDEHLPDLPEAELKVLLFGLRQTRGFQKESDDLSVRQISEGIPSKDGGQFNRGVGIGRSRVFKALRSLEQRGFVSRRSRLGKRSVYVFRVPGEDNPSSNVDGLEPTRPQTRTPPVRKPGRDPSSNVDDANSYIGNSKKAIASLATFPLSVEKLRGAGADDNLIAQVLALCLGASDTEIADAVEWKSHQRAPALFKRTVPENLQRKRSVLTAVNGQDAEVLRLMKGDRHDERNR